MHNYIIATPCGICQPKVICSQINSKVYHYVKNADRLAVQGVSPEILSTVMVNVGVGIT